MKTGSFSRLMNSVATLAALSACGGGGGDDADAPAPAAGNPPAPVVYANRAPAVSREDALVVARGHMAVLETGRYEGSDAVSGYQSYRYIDTGGTYSASCTTGDSTSGSFSINYTDADANRAVSNGDSLTLVYSNCRFDDSSDVVQGLFATDFGVRSGTPAPGQTWSAEFKNRYAGFRTLNGDVFTFEESGAAGYVVGATTTLVDVTTRYENYSTGQRPVLGGVPTSTMAWELNYPSATITFLSDSSGRRTTFNGQSVYTQPSTPNAQPVTSDHTTVQALRFDASDSHDFSWAEIRNVL
jgi:hypothetical protein